MMDTAINAIQERIKAFITFISSKFEEIIRKQMEGVVAYQLVDARL
jgi:hypothetical protein